MKQRLLFLTAFLLLLGTITKAQTPPVINAINIAVTYGAGTQGAGQTLSPADASVVWSFSSSRPDIVAVDANTGMLTFNGSTSESGPVTITINATTTANGPLAPKTITVTVAPKNLRLLPPTNAIQSRAYDGSTVATLIQASFILNASDIVGADASNISLNFTGVSANFETKDVGTDKKVFLTQALSLQGSRAFCYTLTDARPELRGDITKGSQPVNFGLDPSYSKPVADLKLELAPNVKETTLGYQITGEPGVVNVSIDENNKITINFIKTGTTGIRFFTNATSNYNSGDATVSITVLEPIQVNDFTVPSTFAVVYGETGKAIVPTGVKDGAAVSYSISDETVATIGSNGTITTLKAASAIVTVKTAATLNYRESTQTVTLTVSPKPLTITGVSVKSRPYDGTTTAELVWTSASLVGIVSGDNDKVAIDYSGVSVSFTTSNSDINKPISVSGAVTLKEGTGGNKSGNYSLASEVATLTSLNLKGNITKANQPVQNLGLPNSATIFVNQSYSLPFNVSGSPTLSAPNSAAYVYSAGSITFSQAGNHSVIFTATDPAGNYNTAQGTIIFTVKAADVVVFENTEAQTVEYGETQPLGVVAKYSGGTISSGITYNSNRTDIVEVNPSGNISVKAASGSATITVTVAASPNNYSLGVQTVTITARQRDLTLNATINPKTYDGTTTASVSGTVSLNTSRVINPDVVAMGTTPSFAFRDKNVGTGKEIVVNGGSLIGADASKYKLSGSGLSANINKKDQASNLGLPTSLNLKYGEVYTFAPTIAEASTVNTFYSSGATSILEIDNTGRLVHKSIGTATITIRTEAKNASACNYLDATAAVVVTVAKGAQIITVPSSFNKILAEGSFALTPTAYDNPTFVYEAVNNDAGVIEVNSSTGIVTLKRAGTASVLITAQATALYEEKKQVVTITVTEGVAITTQPQAQTSICVGNPFTLSVVATGAVSYQWYKGATAIAGATSATYTIAEATATDGGTYTVRIQGVAGTNPVTSANAVVTVGSGAVITTQLVDRVYCVGSNVTLTVGTSGTNLTYRWYRAGAIIADATTATYTINNIQAANAATYRVDVTGTACNTTTVSSSAQVGVVPNNLPASISNKLVEAEWLSKKTYDIQITVGGNATTGYEGVSKYTWDFSTDVNAFVERETTSRTNTFRVTPNTTTGVLTVVITHPCGNRTLTQSLKAAPLGLEDVTSSGMKVYPNPVVSGSTMTVDLGDGNTGATVYIYNVTGSLAMNVNVKNQVGTIPANLKPGIYMMKIVVPNGKTTHHKFIVK